MLGILGILGLTGCGRQYKEAVVQERIQQVETTAETVAVVTTEAETEEETETESDLSLPAYYLPEERVEEDGKIRSYLTGELVPAAQGNRRPLAIMMSNDKASLPQYGINRAGVVYEAPVEGDMNRFMAVMENYDDLERIGSVRSCRTYYVYFAREFDAVYAHFGQSTFAKPYLKYIDNLNGIDGKGSGAFYRSKDKKAPHNAYASFQKVQSAIAACGYTQDYAPDYAGHYLFARTGRDTVLEDSLEAYSVVPGYPMNKPWFEYHEEDGLYYRFQYGQEHKGDEGQIAVKNIILQYCPSGHYASTDYLNINVHADEYGYYITDGRAIPVSWKKDGDFGVTHYYDTKGNEIILNQGKTWVCIISTADFAKTEINGKQ